MLSKALTCAIPVLLLGAIFFMMPAGAADPTSGKILGGSLNAPIRIEVFSDFECPSCRELYLDVMRRVLVDYSGQNKVCVVYHEYPLRIHRYSRNAAHIAEAVSRLGRDKLLKVYDVLFMDQAQWAQDGNLDRSLAKALTRADVQKVKQILRDPSIEAAVQKGVQLAEQKRIVSTPTWFLYAKGRSEQKVAGRITYIALKQYIDSALR